RSNSTGGRAGSTSSTNGPRLSSSHEVWHGTRFLNMPFYQRLGDVPRKRHIQFRDNGRLLTEEVMGLEGFSGNESILYHLQSPCRVKELGDFEPIERDEWVPDAHAHRRLKTIGIEPEGDELTGRRLLMWNDDV